MSRNSPLCPRAGLACRLIQLAQWRCGQIQTLRFWRMITLVAVAFTMQFLNARWSNPSLVLLDVAAFLLLLLDATVVERLIDRYTESIDMALAEAERLIIFNGPGRKLTHAERALLEMTKFFVVNILSWFKGIRLLRRLPRATRALFCAHVEADFRQSEHGVALLCALAMFLICAGGGVVEGLMLTRSWTAAVRIYLMPLTVVGYVAFMAAKNNFIAYRRFAELRKQAAVLVDEWRHRSSIDPLFKANADPAFKIRVDALWEGIRLARRASPPVAEIIWAHLRGARNDASRDLALELAD